MPTTSVSLLDRLRQPDAQQAWGQFVHLYTPLLHHWSQRLGLQNQDAADLVQEVFLRLLQKLPGFEYKRDGSFRTWLQTVLQNLWRDKCRAQVRAGQPADSIPETVGPDPVAELLDAEYRQRLVGRALELMQTDFQHSTWQAFWAFTVQGKSAAEVAAELGISQASVYVAKSRVLARLRQELDGLLD